MTGVLHQKKKKMVPHTPAVNYRLKSEISITLHRQLCSPCYTALQIQNYSKSTSTIKVATMKSTDDFHYEGKLSHTTTKSTPIAVSKDEWNTKEVHEECIVHTAVCQKAHVRLKRRRTVKKSNL